MSICRPVLNPQILPRGKVPFPLSCASDPSSGDGSLLYCAQLVWMRESGTAHKQLGRHIPLACVLSKVSPTLELSLLLAVS